MRNNKSPLIAIAVIVMLMALVVIGHAASENDSKCEHKNVTVTKTVVCEGDCYNLPEKEITKTCNDCGVVTVMREVSSEYVHGEIEVIDESVPATCSENGMLRIRYVCKNCGQTVGGATQPIMGFYRSVDTNDNSTHNWTEWKSCEDGSLRVRECTICGQEDTQTNLMNDAEITKINIVQSMIVFITQVFEMLKNVFELV